MQHPGAVVRPERPLLPGGRGARTRSRCQSWHLFWCVVSRLYARRPAYSSPVTQSNLRRPLIFVVPSHSSTNLVPFNDCISLLLPLSFVPARFADVVDNVNYVVVFTTLIALTWVPSHTEVSEPRLSCRLRHLRKVIGVGLHPHAEISAGLTLNRTGEESRTPKGSPPLDSESSASTNSATPAWWTQGCTRPLTTGASVGERLAQFSLFLRRGMEPHVGFEPTTPALRKRTPTVGC